MTPPPGEVAVTTQAYAVSGRKPVHVTEATWPDGTVCSPTTSVGWKRPRESVEKLVRRLVRSTGRTIVSSRPS